SQMPGEKSLEAWASPVGKTGYVAQHMEDLGMIVACDRDPERLQTMKRNLPRLDAAIVHILRHSWTNGQLPAEIEALAPFDRILVDARCSKPGVVRLRVAVCRKLT